MERLIPEYKPLGSWRDVPIEECGEPLVSLNTLDSQKVIIYPEDFIKGRPGAFEELYARKTVVERLLQAATLLQDQYGKQYQLKVVDAYRNLELQTWYFNQAVEQQRMVHSEWSQDQLETEAQKYASKPSQDSAHPSPHATGGALDVLLTENGQEALMSPPGAEDFSDVSRTDYYESSDDPNVLIYKKHRRMLYECMTRAGFTNYPEEYWHFDYGNQFWGEISDKKAIYGFCEGGEN